MSSLRKLVNEYKDDLRNGINWVIFWKEGRSWGSMCVYMNITKTGKKVINNQYKKDLEEICNKDPHAIALNGDIYSLFSKGAKVSDMVDAVRYYHEKLYRSTSLENFIEDYTEKEKAKRQNENTVSEKQSNNNTRVAINELKNSNVVYAVNELKNSNIVCDVNKSNSNTTMDTTACTLYGSNKRSPPILQNGYYDLVHCKSERGSISKWY